MPNLWLILGIVFHLLQLQKVKHNISEASTNPEALVLEAVHSVGYKGGLANPLLAPESSISRLNSNVLEEFLSVSLLNAYYSLCSFMFVSYLFS